MANKVIKDGIWNSRKLAGITKEAQLHYPRIYLLIDDWGSFEVDLDIIKGTVYPKMDTTKEEIVGYLQEYHEAGLLFLWKEDAKVYGYFTGSEPGRLQPPSKRHKPKVPAVPKDALEEYVNKNKNLAIDPTDWVQSAYEVPTRCLPSGYGSGTDHLQSDSLNPKPKPNPKQSEGTPTREKGFVYFHNTLGEKRTRIAEDVYEVWLKKYGPQVVENYVLRCNSYLEKNKDNRKIMNSDHATFIKNWMNQDGVKPLKPKPDTDESDFSKGYKIDD